jgi:DNA (cytosine-5)-methyltransferase 1
MKDVFIKGIGTHRGSPRVFLDGPQAVRAGFAPGEKFEVKVDGQRVVLTKAADGSRTVSSRKKGDAQLPVIDINSKELLAAFEGMDSLRVVVGDGQVYLLPLASEIKKRERFDRLARKIAQGQPLAAGSIAHGGGVLAHAIHRGLNDAGIETDLAFVNELREDLIEHAMGANDAWKGGDVGQRTAALSVPMQELVQDDWAMDRLPLLEILEMGLPCSGASRAGAAKRGLDMMESHPEVGHLVYAALVILNKTQPAVVLLENVPTYANTASAQILRQQLRDMGYKCQEAVLEGQDFGCLENRVRWCLVATTRGVDFDFENIQPKVRVVRRLQDVLEDIGPDDPRWRSMLGLKLKQERDAAKGSNFKMQVVSPGDTAIGTLRKGYHKGGSTDPLLQHPDDPELLRLLTAEEHSRVKGVPVHLIEGLSQTVAHQLLGQGIVYEPFRAVGERIGERVKSAMAARRAQQHDQQGGQGAAGADGANADDADEASVRIRRMRMTG